MELPNVIPYQFTLAHRLWRVRWVAHKQLEEITGVECWGACSSTDATIYLSRQLKKQDPALLAHTFEHELLHAIKYTRGELDHDEVAIDGEAALRVQFYQTAKSRR